MSQGLSLLHSIILSGSRSAVRNLRPELFTPDEQPAFQFFTNFYRQYGGFPTAEIMAQNGHPLSVAMGPVDYNLDQIHNRAVGLAATAHLGQLQSALTTRNAGLLRDTVGAMYRDMNQFAANRDVFTLREAAGLVMEDYERAHAAEGTITGVTLGWEPLDALTNGAQGGEVVTFVARPNIGKSYTIAWCAIQAWLQGKSILLVTMEMTVVGFVRRILGLLAGINPDHIKRGHLSIYGEARILDVFQQIEGGPQFIVVAGNLSKSVAQVDALCQEYHPDALYIDAQYLMDATVKKTNAKQHENLADVGKEVTGLALARQIPVFQSVQYNREQGKGKGDLKNIGGSDVVGQISSIVVSIMEGDAPHEHTQRKYEVTKNRDGAKGEMVTNFLFDPIDFSFIPAEQLEGGAVAMNTNWMI